MTISIIIAGLYTSYVNLKYVYACQIKRESLLMTFVLSCVIYCIIAQLRVKDGDK